MKIITQGASWRVARVLVPLVDVLQPEPEVLAAALLDRAAVPHRVARVARVAAAATGAPLDVRQQVVGQAAVLAAFDDGQALLLRQSLGQGEVYFCTILPLLTWSEMGNGLVIVPMLQRLLAAGSRRLQRDSVAKCGEIGAVDLQLEWTSAETSQRGDVQTQAGVYQSGDRWLVVNRPDSEDEFERVEDSAVAGLFGTLPFQLFQAQRDDTPLPSEIWRLILFLMLLALIIEAWLIRPDSIPEAGSPKNQPATA